MSISPDVYVEKLMTAGLLKKIVILVLVELYRFSELIRAIRDSHVRFLLYSMTNCVASRLI